MKSIIFLSLILFAITRSYGQQTGQKSYLSISIGPSIPIGKFANTDDYTRNVGFAKTGEFLKLAITHPVKKNLSITGLLHFQRNPLNTHKLEEDMAKDRYGYPWMIGFGDSIYVPTNPVLVTNPYKNWQVEKSSWYVASLMVGGLAEFPIVANKKLSAALGANLGFCYAWTPNINAKYVNDTLMITATQKSKSGAGMSYSLNSGLHYAISNRTQLKLNVEYFGTTNISFRIESTQFGQETGNSMGSSWGSKFTTETKRSISAVNIGLGVAFAL